MYYIIGGIFAGVELLFCFSLCKAAGKEEKFYEQLNRKNKN